MKIAIVILAVYLINMLCGMGQLLACKLWKVRVEKAVMGKFPIAKNKMSLGLLPIGNIIKLNEEDVINHPKQEWMLLTKQLIPYFICLIILITSFLLSEIEYFQFFFTASAICLFIRLIPVGESEVQGLLYLWNKIEHRERPITAEEIEEVNRPKEEKTELESFVQPKLVMFRMSERKRIIKEMKKNKIGYLQRKIGEWTGNDMVEYELNKRTEEKRKELTEQYYKYNQNRVDRNKNGKL